MSLSPNAKVMIQDLNPRNAPIFFDGYMYVGGNRHAREPDCFAPYVTKDCVPEWVEQAGVGWISQIHGEVEVHVHELMADAEVQVPQWIKDHDLWSAHWRNGLQRIGQRAREEYGRVRGWSEDYDPHRLYFLEEPQRLDHTLTKRDWPTINWGFWRSWKFVSTQNYLP